MTKNKNRPVRKLKTFAVARGLSPLSKLYYRTGLLQAGFIFKIACTKSVKPVIYDYYLFIRIFWGNDVTFIRNYS